jgi:hypothetical protein
MSAEKVILAESPIFTMPSGKILFMKTCSLGSPLGDGIFIFYKKYPFFLKLGVPRCI